MIDNERSSPARDVKIERNGRVVTIFLIEKDDYDAMPRYDVIVNGLREGKPTLNVETLDGRVNGAES